MLFARLYMNSYTKSQLRFIAGINASKRTFVFQPPAMRFQVNGRKSSSSQNKVQHKHSSNRERRHSIEKRTESEIFSFVEKTCSTGVNEINV